jgi:Fic family protein
VAISRQTKERKMPFEPHFTITPRIASALMRIEALKENIKTLPITPGVMKTLRDTARLQSVHYSTKIEGNLLSQKEVERVIKEHEHFVGRQRDEREIKGYYAALEWLEKHLEKPITESAIKTIHALVTGGGSGKIKPTAWRDGQNVIKDSASGAIVYMPPEAKDVPALMTDLVTWVKGASEDAKRAPLSLNVDKPASLGLPCPMVAAIAHYQFTTIHPYYDGNGRTARLLATWVLYQGGYDLKGLYSLEEYYARDLQGYYNAVSRGEHHNYYFGRAEADITPWIDYFITGMLDACENVLRHTGQAQADGAADKSAVLRALTPKQRKVLPLFEEKETITSKDVQALFGFSARSARLLCGSLVHENFLIVVDKADKTRSYKLGAEYEN